MRTYVSQLHIHLGPISVVGRLVAIQKSEANSSSGKVKTTMVTADGSPVEQMYRDPAGELHYPADLARAIEDDEGNLKVVDPDTLREMKASDLPSDVLTLAVHEPSEVSNFLFPSDHKSYLLEPQMRNHKNKVIDDPANDRWYDFLTTIVRESGLTFVGVCNLRNNGDGLYRLGIYQGHLLIQRMLYPEDLNQYEVVNPQISPVEKEKAMKLVRSMVKPFDVEEYRNVSAERLAESLRSDTGSVTLDTSGPVRTEEFDLASALDELL